MKRFFAPLALLALPLLGMAQELPAKSPSATVSQRIGLTDVTITYSRPSMNGRRIFGDLVPFDQVWRTGANGCTVIRTSGPIIFGANKLEAGSYSLFTIPHDGAWEVILNKNTDLWGAYDRKAEEDILTVKAEARDAMPTETFTIEFANLTQDKADLVIRWEKREAIVHLTADATSQGLENIKQHLAKPDADHEAYARCASFCLDRGIEPKSALEWANKSVSMKAEYWNTFTLAKVYASMGDYANAVARGKEAIALAIEQKETGAQKSYQAQVDLWSAKTGGK